jgi:gluconate 2-dehydrogenase gamma chain
MSTYSTDRRSVLRIIGAVGATCAYPFSSENLHGQTLHKQTESAGSHHEASPEQPAQPRFFNDHDYQTLSRIDDLIIPDTDTAGAIKAGVPGYLDAVIARDTDQQLLVADGLRWLDHEGRRIAGKPFIEMNEAQQLGLLEPLCEASDADPKPKARNVQFFALLKKLTADGYYTSKIGLLDELQYRGNHVLASYPSCSSGL